MANTQKYPEYPEFRKIKYEPKKVQWAEPTEGEEEDEVKARLLLLPHKNNHVDWWLVDRGPVITAPIEGIVKEFTQAEEGEKKEALPPKSPR